MRESEIRGIAESMARRSGQWRSRLIIAAIIALVSFPLTSWGFALGWLAVYGLLQIVEGRLHPDGSLARRLSQRDYVRLCLVQTFLNNVAFGAYGAAEILSGSLLGVACGTMVVGGVVVNAVMISPGSRTMMATALIPQALYLTLLPVGAVRAGLTTFETVQITFAGVFLVFVGLTILSHIGRLFREAEAARAAAEEANQAKSRFLATMSHEIRTPLNGILGMAQAMGADDLPPRQRERLAVVTQSGQSLLHILGDVLDLAKIEAGKLELEQMRFDLAALVDQTQANFRALAEGKGLGFEVSVTPAAAGDWMGDPTRLRQILANLISNAVKFTEAGRISVVADADDAGLVLTVADTGPGVTPEHLPRLFQKFVQADGSTTRRYGGTGLGLSICEDLARLMGGDIQARHAQPHGLVFEVRLPLRRAEEAAASQDRPQTGAAVTFDGGGLRVLAAEDHPVNRQVLTLLLSQIGITPHLVENGAQAVEAWRAGDWDLILMDVQMPIMDGPTAAAAIRAEEAGSRRPHTPIIALTANVMTQQIDSYRRAGMDQSVAKPIEIQALVTAIAASQTGRAA